MTIKDLQSKQHTFSVLELDITPALGTGFGLDPELPLNNEFFQEIYHQIGLHLLPHASGVILEPRFTFPRLGPALKKQGLALRLEQIVAEVDPLSVPRLITDWGIEHIHHNYAVAKLGLYYHPQEAEALHKKQLVAEIADFCKQEGIELLLDVKLYDLPLTALGNKSSEVDVLAFPDAQLQAVQELRSLCHLISVQVPADALTAATITAELDSPWIVSLGNQDYATAKENLRLCLESGARGFVAGECLWQEAYSLRLPDHSPDLAAIQNFISTQAKDRIIELARIANEFEH